MKSLTPQMLRQPKSGNGKPVAGTSDAVIKNVQILYILSLYATIFQRWQNGHFNLTFLIKITHKVQKAGPVQRKRKRKKKNYYYYYYFYFRVFRVPLGTNISAVILLWETYEQMTQTTARCGVLAKVGIRIHVFWNIIPCQMVTSYPVFRWLYTPLTLHSVTYLKTQIFKGWLPNVTTDYTSESQV